MSEKECLSDTSMSECQKFLDAMTEFIQNQRQKLSNVMENLGINKDELLKTEEKQVCPFNNNHIVPEKKFKTHIRTCRLLSAGYQKDELPAVLQNVDFCYENTDSTMKIEIDENLLNKIIWDHSVQNGQVYTGHRPMPVSHIDENIHLTQEDRLAVYQYAVNKSHEAGKVIPVDRHDDLLTTDWGSLVKKGLLDEQNNKQYASKLEQLAALRDMKRRRQSYRAKNVHITKKSYTEIIREVISNQMEILEPDKTLRSGQSMNSEAFKERDRSYEYESKTEGRHRDYDSSRERHRGHRDDGAESRSRDKHYKRRGVSSEKEKHRKRSRDRSLERSRDRSRERQRDRDRGKGSRDGSYDRSRSRLRFRDEESPEFSTSTTERPRRFTEANSLPESSTTERPRRSTDTYNLLIKEIKQETVTGDQPCTYSQSTESRSEDVHADDMSDSDEPQKLRKHSDSESESSEMKHNKHKKSKHKKKHSKKHKTKRRD